ncbi:MAG: MmcQ/YjbR family DNA-binding protein [Spirochaetes bacterium]|nr:MmcQ/YjbR family DNA-binding protein [Spirochaetota bacterium]
MDNTVKKYLLSKNGSFLDFPFEPDAAVFKVGSKMFALYAVRDDKPYLNLKCDPDDAEIMRSMFKSVEPAYHMNKRHWNTVRIGGDVPDEILFKMIDDSYELVKEGMSREEKNKLK